MHIGIVLTFLFLTYSVFLGRAHSVRLSQMSYHRFVGLASPLVLHILDIVSNIFLFRFFCPLAVLSYETMHIQVGVNSGRLLEGYLLIEQMHL